MSFSKTPPAHGLVAKVHVFFKGLTKDQKPEEKLAAQRVKAEHRSGVYAEATCPEVSFRTKLKLGRCRIEDFEMGRVIGTGSFGRVYVAHKKENRQVFATKALSKACILNQRQLEHLKSEKDLLQKLEFPFIVNLVGYSQDVTHVYLVMDYVPGGEFFSYLRKMKKFDEETARFYAAQVLLTFEHLHKMGIVYRDLKPENLLLDDKGDIKLADFGFAKSLDSRTYTVCGTPDYLAPEVIIGKGHGTAVDWWAFGVLIYEMLAGYAPFYDTDPTGTYQKILVGEILLPPHFSRSAKDLIRKLLDSDLSKRPLMIQVILKTTQIWSL